MKGLKPKIFFKNQTARCNLTSNQQQIKHNQESISSNPQTILINILPARKQNNKTVEFEKTQQYNSNQYQNNNQIQEKKTNKVVVKNRKSSQVKEVSALNLATRLKNLKKNTSHQIKSLSKSVLSINQINQKKIKQNFEQNKIVEIESRLTTQENEEIFPIKHNFEKEQSNKQCQEIFNNNLSNNKKNSEQFQQKNIMTIKQYKVKISKLQEQIRKLQLELKQKSNFITRLSTSASSNSQKEVQNLGVTFNQLFKKIKMLEQQRQYLYENIANLIRKMNKKQNTSQLKQQYLKLEQEKLEQIKERQQIINGLRIQLSNEIMIKNQIQNKNKHIQHKLDQLLSQNMELKRQLKIKNLKQSSITSKSFLLQQSIIVSEKQFDKCSISQKCNLIKSQLPISNAQSRSFLNQTFLTVHSTNSTNQISLQVFILSSKLTLQAKEIIIKKLISFYHSNNQKHIINYYDPQSLIIKGKSKFLQIIQRSDASFTIYDVNEQYVAPQIICQKGNIEICEETSLVWNLGKIICYVLNIKEQIHIEQQISSEWKLFYDYLGQMLHINPEKRPKINEISENVFRSD